MLFRYAPYQGTGTRIGWDHVFGERKDSRADYIRSWPNLAEDITPDSSWPNAKVFYGPKVPISFHDVNLIIKNKAKAEKVRDTKCFPDITQSGNTMMVSEAFKNVVEAIDDMEHQFTPTKVVDKNGDVLTSQPMYRMHIRRFLIINDIGAEFQYPEFVVGHAWKFDLKKREMYIKDHRERRPITGDRSLLDKEKPAIAAIQSNQTLREKIETLPFWRVHGSDHALYMNQETIEQLWDADLTGLKEFSQVGGKKEETVSHV